MVSVCPLSFSKRLQTIRTTRPFRKRARQIQERNETVLYFLQEPLLKHSGEADKLVSRFHQVLSGWNTDGESDTARVDELLDHDTEQWIGACERHLKLADDNYYSFLLKPYQGKRSQPFNCLGLLNLTPTSEDDRTIQALDWITQYRNMRRPELDNVPESLSDGGWLTERWRSLILKKGEDNTYHWRRNYLELAVFTLVMESLNAGDICIESGDQFSDYRSKLISWEEYHQAIAQYSEQVGLPAESDEFVEKLKRSLEQAATNADQSFPGCEQVRFDNGRLVLTRPESKTKKAKLVELQRRLDDKMPSLSILDLLVESEKWLDLFATEPTLLISYINLTKQTILPKACSIDLSGFVTWSARKKIIARQP